MGATGLFFFGRINCIYAPTHTPALGAMGVGSVGLQPASATGQYPLKPPVTEQALHHRLGPREGTYVRDPSSVYPQARDTPCEELGLLSIISIVICYSRFTILLRLAINHPGDLFSFVGDALPVSIARWSDAMVVFSCHGPGVCARSFFGESGGRTRQPPWFALPFLSVTLHAHRM